MITILGHDPGTANAAYSVVSFKPPAKKGSKWKFKIRELGMLKNTLTDMKDDQESQLGRFAEELCTHIPKHKVDCVIAERFMIRSFRTATAEYVSVMLGYLICYLEHKVKGKARLVTVPAVTWKNAVKKLFVLNDFYKSVHAFPHEIDATLMAFYQAGCLDLLSKENDRMRLVCQLEKRTSRPAKRVRKQEVKKPALKSQPVRQARPGRVKAATEPKPRKNQR